MYEIHTNFDNSIKRYKTKKQFDIAVQRLYKFNIPFIAYKDGIQLTEYSDYY
jgi:hypothetical protein